MAKHIRGIWRRRQDPQRFKHLPERVDPRRTVTSKATNRPRDPEGGRDTDRDFVIRYGAGDFFDDGA
jgi:hypothetical protein